MTTHLISGVQVTFSGNSATAVTATSLRLTTTDTFSFRYSITAPVSGGFAPISVTASYPSSLHATHVGATRVNLNTNGRIAEYQWGTNKATLILMVETGVANVKHFFVLDGDPLPAFANAAAYSSFMAGVTRIVSDARSMQVDKVPGLRILPSDLPGYVSGVQNDVITGGAGDNWSIKTLYTGIGNDSITALETNDRIDAGAGDDSISALGGNDNLSAGQGNDLVYGGSGNDTMRGGDGNDSFAGGDGNDYLDADSGNDLIMGDAGNDTLVGDFGDDSLLGGAGSDSILGSYGNDTLRGGTESDRLIAGDGDDFLDGEAGNDTLRGDRGDDSLLGNAGDDRLEGGAGDDTLSGGTDNDLLMGGLGNDTLRGDAGNDTLQGGDGVDVLTGGAGSDRLNGGMGADVFMFGAASGTDTVVDFRDNIDTIRLSTSLGISSVAQAMDHAAQVGRNVHLTFGSDTLIINSTTLLKLSNDIEVI